MTGLDPRYGAEVRRRMATMSGAGDLAAGPGVVRVAAGDREQGTEIVLAARIDGDRVVELRFRAFGCPHLIAAASWVTDRLRGASRTELERWDWQELVTTLEVPPAKFGRLLTLQDAVRALARNWPGALRSTV
jgi:NifU-like protein involved in Fe-S cluster formation